MPQCHFQVYAPMTTELSLVTNNWPLTHPGTEDMKDKNQPRNLNVAFYAMKHCLPVHNLQFSREQYNKCTCLTKITH